MQWKSYLGPFPDKAEWWFLVIEDARLDSWEVGVLKELTLLQAALPKPLKLRAHHFALTRSLSSSHRLHLTRSHSRDPGPLGLAVRSGLVAREVAAEERVARRACWYKPPSILGQAVAAESWALPRFLVRPTQSCGNHRKACVSMHAITTCT